MYVFHSMSFRNLQDEYDRLKSTQSNSRSAKDISASSNHFDEPHFQHSRDSEMLAEAKLLRQHKGRLEARMQILEDHNRQLEAQLQRLRQLLDDVSHFSFPLLDFLLKLDRKVEERF